MWFLSDLKSHAISPLICEQAALIMFSCTDSFALQTDYIKVEKSDEMVVTCIKCKFTLSVILFDWNNWHDK